MIFKSYIVEQNIQCLSGYKIFLFYGENEGLKRDLKKNLRVDNKDSEILNLFLKISVSTLERRTSLLK